MPYPTAPQAAAVRALVATYGAPARVVMERLDAALRAGDGSVATVHAAAAPRNSHRAQRGPCVLRPNAVRHHYMKDIYYLAPDIRATACTMTMFIDEYGIDGYAITRIEVAPNLRGRGYGSRLLELVCRDADQEQETLYLEVAPDESGGLDYDELTAWYERYGFEHFGAMMRRFPKETPLG